MPVVSVIYIIYILVELPCFVLIYEYCNHCLFCAFIVYCSTPGHKLLYVNNLSCLFGQYIQ